MGLDGTTITSSITQADYSSILDLTTGHSVLNVSRGFALANGTGVNQADKIWSDTRTLTASSSEDLDLAGVLTDAFGATLTFARIKVILIAPYSTNTNNVIVGNAATNGFITWVGGATHTVTVRPGGMLLLGAPDATAYAVTAGTGDLLHVANSGAGTSVTYDVVLVGSSA